MIKNKEKFTNATVFYNCDGEQRHVFLTNRNFTKTMKQLNRCSWITVEEIIKYDFSDTGALSKN